MISSNTKQVYYKPNNIWTRVNNKTKKENRMYRTKFCNKDFCDKEDCNFAHSYEELNTICCNWGDTCKQIFIEDGLVKNKNNFSICKYKHRLETKEHYLERINTKKNEYFLETTVENIHEDIDDMIKKGIKNFQIHIGE